MKLPLVLAIFSLFFIHCQGYKEDSRDREYEISHDLFAKGAPVAFLKKDDPTLQEASGLVVSRANDKHFWANNDSGDGPHLYLFDLSGKIKLKVVLDQTEAIDWEELSIQTSDSVTYLYIGDIGDNEAIRESISIHRIKEPPITDMTELTINRDGISTMVLQYAEGARDAEAFFYDPADDQLILLTKREAEVMVYAFKFEASEVPVTITSKGKISLRNFTSADVLPNGDILIKNYDNIFYWKRSGKSAATTLLEDKPVRIPYVKEPQGEAISADAKGNFYTISERSEHAKQELFFYRKND